MKKRELMVLSVAVLIISVSGRTYKLRADSNIIGHIFNPIEFSLVTLDTEMVKVGNIHIANEEETGDILKQEVELDMMDAVYKLEAETVITDLQSEIQQGLEVIEQNKQEEKQREYDKWLKREVNKHKTAKGVKFNIPKSWNTSFKAYMAYQAVTSVSSPQYKLLRGNSAYTDKNGLRMVDGRYCVAVGSAFTSKIGTKLDVKLCNGVIIPCILGDQKSDRHTVDRHMRCGSNGSVVEFIIDRDSFKGDKSGTVNFAGEGWGDNIESITVISEK